ncbi:MAG TPA: UBP-type zinc finger domain-containing protein [Actinomycetospora sp.]|nr:UBP-type zinc finger domain-containing protein [Actinomycetospora sp.]
MTSPATGPEIDPHARPSGTGCLECDETGGWWFHLRRCAACGHIGCCDSSPSQHATRHAREHGHPILTSFEPGEDWFFDDRDGTVGHGPVLAGAQNHPEDQTVPGPADRVPADWQRHLH